MAGMLKIVPLSLILALTTASFCGCGNSHRWQGKWVGKRDVKPRPGEDISILNTLTKIELTVHSDGRFDLLQSGVPFGGRIRDVGKKAYLKVDSYFNKYILDDPSMKRLTDSEIELSAVNENEISFHDPTGFDEKPVVLKREITSKSASQP